MPAINDITHQVIRTKNTTPAFREGWDRIWGKKDKQDTSEKELMNTKTEDIDHSSRDHAEFSPSQLKYLKSCAGYEGKEGTSEAAERGTRIHEALEVFDPSSLHDEEELEIYEQIVKMEEEYLANVGFEKGKWEELNEIRVEIKLPNNETFGTCDRLLIHPDEESAVMADYKTGISIIDHPSENYQAKAYVIGAFQKFPKLQRISFVFYIPLHNSSPDHTFTRDQLPALESELDSIVSRASATRPKWKLGTPNVDELNANQHCRFCRYEESCPALGGLVKEVAEQVEPVSTRGVSSVILNEESTPEQYEAVFNIAKILQGWAERTKKQVVEALKEGKELPTLRLRSMGATKKVEDNEYFVRIAEQHGISKDDLLAGASLPFAKLSKLADDPAAFTEACLEAGVVSISPERLTVR